MDTHRMARALGAIVLAAGAFRSSWVGAAGLRDGAAPATRAQAATPAGPTSGAHTIQGSLVNGTSGAPSPNGLLVTLNGYDNFAVSVTLTATADSAGAFTFQNVPDVTGRYFMLSVPYEGVPYSSDLLKFDPNVTSLNAKVQLYETTGDPSGLHFAQVHLVFDLSNDGATVTEIGLISNNSGKTFVAPPGAGLTIPVPNNAAAVAVQNQQGSIAATRTAQGLQINAPLLPGASTAELVFTFRLLSRLPAFEQSWPLAVDSLTVFVPSGGPAPEGSGLTEGGTQTFQGKSYHVFTGGPHAAGNVIAFQLGGGTASGAGSADPNIPIIVALGLLNLLLLIGVGALWWRRVGGRRGRPRPSRGQAQDDLDVPRVAD